MNEWVDTGGHSAWIQVDIAGAFDNAWHPAIIIEMILAGMPGYIINIVRNYLKNRQAVITIQHMDFTIKAEKGCPQGSILGPFLWNLVISKLLREPSVQPAFMRTPTMFFLLSIAALQKCLEGTVSVSSLLQKPY